MIGSLPRAVRRSCVLAALLAVAACSTSGFFGEGRGTAAQAPAPDMRGRWTLSSPGRGLCIMNFGGAPGAAEGTIAPEGGCPGSFFTSRRWALDHDGLSIRNHKDEPLGQFALSAGGRFDGRSSGGEPVSLQR